VVPTSGKACNEDNLPVIPPASNCQVWIDFDGTLTKTDVLDTLIAKYSKDDSWRAIELAWQEGRIGSRACLEYEFNLLRIFDHELNAEIRDVQLDPGAKALMCLLRTHDIPTAILSDGVDWIIERILKQCSIPLPAIRANTARHGGERLELVCLTNNSDCASAAAHCKCASRDKLHGIARVSIYIGDGQSDLCAARGCEIVFAKDRLGEAFSKEGLPFRRFDTLIDVHRDLSEAWSNPVAVDTRKSTFCLSPHQL
jgi:2,3-diketo-5-methylthio-1-phosphopentane phosphatase